MARYRRSIWRWHQIPPIPPIFPDTLEVMLTSSWIALHHDHVVGDWMLCANGTRTWVQRTRFGDYGYVREGDRRIRDPYSINHSHQMVNMQPFVCNSLRCTDRLAFPWFLLTWKRAYSECMDFVPTQNHGGHGVIMSHRHTVGPVPEVLLMI